MNHQETEEQLHWAELILDSWSKGQPFEYTDFMVSPEVESVRDIGDAINNGALKLAPTAQHVQPGRTVEPFTVTLEVLEKLGRIESARDRLRARRVFQ